MMDALVRKSRQNNSQLDEQMNTRQINKAMGTRQPRTEEMYSLDSDGRGSVGPKRSLKDTNSSFDMNDSLIPKQGNLLAQTGNGGLFGKSTSKPQRPQRRSSY